MTAAAAATASSAHETTSLCRKLEFLKLVGKLKEVKRTGWVRSGVAGAESVADHMYRMAMMGFLMGLSLDKSVSVNNIKCIKMALVHDIGESLIGDLVTEGNRPDKISREEKIQRERNAIRKISDVIGGDVGSEIAALWEEFEAGDSVEAQHLRDLDKFEMIVQASEYETAQDLKLHDFFRTTEGKFGTQLFKELDTELRRRRAELQRSDDSGKQHDNQQTSTAADGAHTARIFEFLRIVGKLKEVKRTGWVRSGVQGAESVADHMYRMALMGFTLGQEQEVDQHKCIKMALVHDLGESLIGDLVTEGNKPDKISREDKIIKERNAMKQICEVAGDEVGAEIQSLWEEFEEGVSKEAKHLRDLDKFEMVLQASEYEEAQGMQLQDFFRTTEGKLVTPTFRALDAEVRKRRIDREATSCTSEQTEALLADQRKRARHNGD